MNFDLNPKPKQKTRFERIKETIINFVKGESQKDSSIKLNGKS